MNPSRIRFSFQWRAALVAGILAFLVSGIPSFVLLRYAENRQLEELDRRAEILLDGLNYLTADAIVQDDLLVLNDSILRYVSGPDIESIAVYDETNRLLYFSDGRAVVTLDSPAVSDAALRFRLFDDPALKDSIASNRASYRASRLWNATIHPYKQTVSRLQQGKGAVRTLEFSQPIHHPNPAITRQLGTLRAVFHTDRIEESLRATRRELLLFIAVLMAASILVTALTTRVLTRPILLLAEEVKVVAGGKLDHRVPENRSDEIGLLAREFNQMTGALERSQKQLVAKRVTEREIEIAATIQASLLPPPSSRRGRFRMAAWNKAAREMGGDYFDIVGLGDDFTSVTLADVSGKGIPAALIMSMIKSSIHVALGAGIRSPRELGSIINRYLAASTEASRFATMQILLLDDRTGEVVFTNCGHGPLRHFRRLSMEWERPHIPGIPAGFKGDAEYAEGSLRMDPGDFLLLFTDGASEARRPDKESIGAEAIERIAAQLKDEDAETISQGVAEGIQLWCEGAPLYDDRTLLVIQRTT